jgi:hypothetical protein
MTNLAEILGTESLVLVDLSIKCSNTNISQGIDCLKRSHQLKARIVDEETYALEAFADVLMRPNVYTIAEVTDEINKFERILSAAANNLSSRNPEAALKG